MQMSQESDTVTPTARPHAGFAPGLPRGRGRAAVFLARSPRAPSAARRPRGARARSSRSSSTVSAPERRALRPGKSRIASPLERLRHCPFSGHPLQGQLKERT